jgi:hypothetical protein
MVETALPIHVPSSLDASISDTTTATPDFLDLQRSLSADYRSKFIEHSPIYEKAFRHPGPANLSQHAPAKPTASEEDDPWANKAVLCLDGGGVRGLSSLFVLERLMEVIATCERNKDDPATTSADSPLLKPQRIQEEMQRLSPAQTTKSNFLPCHYFDYIAGTSTGGLIAILLGRLRMSVSSVMQEYLDLSSRVFAEREWKHLPQVRSLFHRRNNKEDILVDKIASLGSPASDEDGERKEGERIFQSDGTRCRTIVCSLRRNMKSGSMAPFLFRSYDRAVAVDHSSPPPSPEASSFPISEVVRATVRAQDSLKSIHLGEGRYCDAGMGLNNPSIHVYQEVVRLHQQTQGSAIFDPVSLFLSIGSGFSHSDASKNSSSSDERDTLGHLFSKVGRALYAISESVHRSMEDLHKSSKPFSYYRFDVPDALNSIALDKWNNSSSPTSTYSRIRVATLSYLDTQRCRNSLAECAKNLVDRRRKRCGDAQWETFAFGTRYWCEHLNLCDHKRGGAKPFETRDELLNHLRLEHLMPPPDADHDTEIKKLVEKGRTNSD